MRGVASDKCIVANNRITCISIATASEKPSYLKWTNWSIEAKLQPESGSLPCAGTQQSPKNTRQRLCRVLHSANDTRRTQSRQTFLCRVLKPTLGKKSNVTARRRSWRVCRVSCRVSHSISTRQIYLVCRVSTKKNSTNNGFCEKKTRSRRAHPRPVWSAPVAARRPTSARRQPRRRPRNAPAPPCPSVPAVVPAARPLQL